MKPDALCTWRSLTDDRSVRWLKYSFGPGTANTLAVRLDEGTWLVVSPAVDAPSAALDELSKDGAVTALLAPNPYHHRGQQAWRLRFPEAVSYAPEGALQRLAKKSPDIVYHPIAELAERATARVSFFVPDGLKAPDMLLRVSAGGGNVWWMGDLFSNSAAGDQVWWLRLLAPLFGSGLGYRRNSKPGVVYVKDQGTWLRSIGGAIAAHSPSVVVPAHGDPVVDDTASRTQALVNAAR